MIASRTINCTLNRIIILLLVALVQIVNCYNFQSDHTVDLDENYRLLWQIKGDDIIFEIQVRTLGYVGLGFSRDGSLYGADVVIGWVDQGQAFFQVSNNKSGYYFLFHLVTFRLLCPLHSSGKRDKND